MICYKDGIHISNDPVGRIQFLRRGCYQAATELREFLQLVVVNINLP